MGVWVFEGGGGWVSTPLKRSEKKMRRWWGGGIFRKTGIFRNFVHKVGLFWRFWAFSQILFPKNRFLTGKPGFSRHQFWFWPVTPPIIPPRTSMATTLIYNNILTSRHTNRGFCEIFSLKHPFQTGLYYFGLYFKKFYIQKNNFSSYHSYLCKKNLNFLVHICKNIIWNSKKSSG